MKQASVSSGVQGGGKRRSGSALTYCRSRATWLPKHHTGRRGLYISRQSGVPHRGLSGASPCAAGLIVHVGERLPLGVADAEALGCFVDFPRRPEVAFGRGANRTCAPGDKVPVMGGCYSDAAATARRWNFASGESIEGKPPRRERLGEIRACRAVLVFYAVAAGESWPVVRFSGLAAVVAPRAKRTMGSAGRYRVDYPRAESS
jgi:hypothetical protein